MSKISLEQAQAELEAGFVPRMHSNTLMFVPALLKSSLFSARTGVRTMYAEETKLASHPTAQVFYTGEELRQDDLRVLLALVKLREGSLASRELRLTPRQFCVEMGRADSSTSVATVKESLIRLQRARVRVVTIKAEGYYSLVSDVSFERGLWRVSLSDRIAELLSSSTLTCLDKNVRFGVRDGLQSWLYGAVRADAWFVPMAIEKVQEWTGLTGYSQKEFVRVLKKELQALKESGEIDSYAVTDSGKKLRIVKRAKETVH